MMALFFYAGLRDGCIQDIEAYSKRRIGLDAIVKRRFSNFIKTRPFEEIRSVFDDLINSKEQEYLVKSFCCDMDIDSLFIKNADKTVYCVPLNYITIIFNKLFFSEQLFFKYFDKFFSFENGVASKLDHIRLELIVDVFPAQDEEFLRKLFTDSKYCRYFLPSLTDLNKFVKFFGEGTPPVKMLIDIMAENFYLINYLFNGQKFDKAIATIESEYARGKFKEAILADEKLASFYSLLHEEVRVSDSFKEQSLDRIGNIANHLNSSSAHIHREVPKGLVKVLDEAQDITNTEDEVPLDLRDINRDTFSNRLSSNITQPAPRPSRQSFTENSSRLRGRVLNSPVATQSHVTSIRNPEESHTATNFHQPPNRSSNITQPIPRPDRQSSTTNNSRLRERVLNSPIATHSHGTGINSREEESHTTTTVIDFGVSKMAKF